MGYRVVGSGRPGGQGRGTEALGNMSRVPASSAGGYQQRRGWLGDSKLHMCPRCQAKTRYRSKFRAWLAGHTPIPVPPVKVTALTGHVCDRVVHPSQLLSHIPPVALAYTTLAWGSLLCRSSTALPILVELAFLALWHSSNTIWDTLG